MKVAIKNGKTIYTLMLILIGGISMAEAGRTEKALVRKDDEVCRLLLRMKTPARYEAARELGRLPEEKVRAGLAYALIRHDTREQALRYILASFNEPKLVPFILEAMKWGKGSERLLAIEVLEKMPSKAAIPVLLHYALELPFAKTYTTFGEHSGIRTGRVSTFVCGSRLLYRLSEGKIGSDKLSDRMLITLWERKKLLLQWRQWWYKKSSKILPEWKAEGRDFKTKKQVRQWCEQRIKSWPKAMANDAQKAFDDFSVKMSFSVLSRPNADLDAFYCPNDIVGPVFTPVLMRTVLGTASGGVAPGKVADKSRLQTHRLALLCLSRSRDWEVVTSFLDWAFANGKIRDFQATAYTLGRMKSPNAAEVLKKMLITKTSDKARLEIVRSLGKTKVSQAADPLIKFLAENDIPKGIHQLAQRSLLEIGRAGPTQEKSIAESLRPLLTSKQDEHVLVALRVLAEIGRENARQVIKASMTDFNDKTRPIAEKAIGLIESRIREYKKYELLRRKLES